MFRVHFTPARLHRMGLRENPDCTRCSRDHGDLIHLLCRCPKLHLYWAGVVATINKAFQVAVPMDSKPCILGILDDLSIEHIPKQAISRALFQARKLILRHWRGTEPPTLQEWITQMGDTLMLEKYIFQHRGRPEKFNTLWSPWLDTPALSPVELVLDRLFSWCDEWSLLQMYERCFCFLSTLLLISNKVGS